MFDYKLLEALACVVHEQGLEHIRSGLLVDILLSCHIGVTLYWHRWSLKSKLLDDFSRSIVKNVMIC